MKQNRVPLSKPIPVKLPPEILDRLDAVSKRLGEPRSTVMRIALRLGIEELEKLGVEAGVGQPSSKKSAVGEKLGGFLLRSIREKEKSAPPT